MVEELQMAADLEDQLNSGNMLEASHASFCTHLPHDENQIKRLELLLRMVSTTHQDRCHNLGIPLGYCF